MATNIVRFLIYIFLPAIPVCFVSSFDNIDGEYSKNNNVIKLQNIDKFDELDILFIGNSYSYSCLIPSFFDSLGINTFNYGIATAGSEFYDLMTSDYLTTNKTPPKSIFLVISPTIFTSKANNFIEYPIHRYLKNPKSNFEIIKTYSLWRDAPFILRKSFLKGFENIFLSQKNRSNIKELLLNKGYIPSTIVNSKEITQKQAIFYNRLKNDSFNWENFEAIKRMCYQFEEKGIKVAFFEPPTNQLSEFLSPKLLEEYEIAKKQLKDSFIIFQNKTILKESHYRNIDHINSAGAKLYTLDLITQLKKSNRFSEILNNPN